MLRGLVSKFESQKLDEAAGADERPLRKSARLATLPTAPSISHAVLQPSTEADSGTESDEELQRIDDIRSSGLGKAQSTSVSERPSPPTFDGLCDTNSRDSTGCESGIVMHESDDDVSRDPPDDLTAPLSATGRKRPCDSAGAFQPVSRRSFAGIAANISSRDVTAAGRRRGASDRRARTAPVRLLIAPPGVAVPAKRSRSNRDAPSPQTVDEVWAPGRPSLDFEKMREKMMKAAGEQRHLSKRTQQLSSARTIFKERSADESPAPDAAQTSDTCAQLDCLFRPVEPSTGDDGQT